MFHSWFFRTSPYFYPTKLTVYMKIVITRKNSAFEMEADNGEGNLVTVDGSSAIGGNNLGMRPMQLVLAALGSCSSIDVISILKKQQQEPFGLKVEVEGTRAEGQVPAVFTAIHVHYVFTGKPDAQKAEKAIVLSMEKYCSVSKMLEKTVAITHSFEIQP